MLIKIYFFKHILRTHYFSQVRNGSGIIGKLNRLYNSFPGSKSRRGRGRIKTAVLGAGSRCSCDFRTRKSY